MSVEEHIKYQMEELRESLGRLFPDTPARTALMNEITDRERFILKNIQEWRSAGEFRWSPEVSGVPQWPSGE